MRLNPDCIRDILLAVEETTTLSKHMTYPNESSILASYSNEEVMYHIRQCELSGLLTKVEWYMELCLIFDLSPKGHKFLSDIRSDNVWNKTKSIATTIGSFSLDALTIIATNVISELIKSQFH